MKKPSFNEVPFDGTAVDFGSSGNKCVAHDKSGPAIMPRITRSSPVWGTSNASRKFTWRLAQFLAKGDVAMEAATIGSSGAEPTDIARVVNESPHRLAVLSGHAVKNWRKDHNETTKLTDARSAEIQYILATENPDALTLWTKPHPHRRHKITVDQYLVIRERVNSGEPIESILRKYSSPRPYDKRGYCDPFVYEKLANLPSIEKIDEDFRQIIGITDDKKMKKHGEDWSGYNAPDAFPLALSLEEYGAEDFETWEDDILGHRANGPQSFYRRKVNSDLVMAIAKYHTKKRLNSEITYEERKDAHRALNDYLFQMHSLIFS